MQKKTLAKLSLILTSLSLFVLIFSACTKNPKFPSETPTTGTAPLTNGWALVAVQLNHKYSSDYNYYLKGNIQVSLYDNSGKLLATKTTTKSDTLNFGKLNFGTYKVTENAVETRVNPSTGVTDDNYATFNESKDFTLNAFINTATLTINL